MSTEDTRTRTDVEPATRPLGVRAVDRTAEMEAVPATASRRRRTVVTAALGVFLLLTGAGLAAGTYYYDSVPAPEQLSLPESTTVYYSDGTTVMAKLGTENRTLLTYDEMNQAVKDAIVAAEDRTFWTNPGIDAKGVLRAAWNNLTGGETQGGSTITQQYARVAAELKGVTYSRKLREAIMAWKLARSHDKYQILEYYLNTVPFGRGAYGVEAAAQAYFGKSASNKAPLENQITLAEAMVLVAMVKQPEPDPNNPEGAPGYDPTRSPLARQNSIDRWHYIKQGLVETGALTQAEADALVYPDTVLEYDPSKHQSGLDRPTGLVVNHVLSELRQTEELGGDRPVDYIVNGGFRIVTTIDSRAQQAAEAAADIRRETAPEAVRGQPENWQAALVAVEPGTGRVLAYYGGDAYNGADHAGWYYNDEGNPAGFGYHPPGSTFKVYDLAEALRRGISVDSVWDSPPTKEFPASGRTRDSQAGPVRNAGRASCQPNCTLVEATVASLNVPFFDLTEQLGAASVIEMAARAGIDSMWATVDGRSVRVDLRGRVGSEVAPSLFSTEVGIGQYPITVLDHANGMATFAAGGKRAQVHFVRSVESDGRVVYQEDLTQTDVGLTEDQVKILTATLHQVPTARFDDKWDAAGKTGTWQAGDSITENAHVWMVGYTRALAAAVWVGTTDGKALITSDGDTDVFGSTHAGPIWRQFMAEASEAMEFSEELRRFEPPPAPSPTAEPTPEPTAEPTPEPSPTPEPTVEPTPEPTGTPRPDPTGTPPPTSREPTITVSLPRRP
ncbi:MAG TPA: transglycosylase domain-containing protein [Micromonosporaceae bacterium]|nr:transglycosylase domain-containing protein [Micromonosporaceae bacterium]